VGQRRTLVESFSDVQASLSCWPNISGKRCRGNIENNGKAFIFVVFFYDVFQTNQECSTKEMKTKKNRNPSVDLEHNLRFVYFEKFQKKEM